MMWDLMKFESNTALLSDDGTSLTYGALDAADKELAAAVGGRCLVFSLCTNTVGSVVGYTAFISNNIVPVLLNAHLDQQLLFNLMEAYNPAYLWVPSDMIEDLMTAGNISASDPKVVYERFNYSLIKTGYEKCYPLYEELGLLLTTSGSTGSPKFVRQSYRNILYNAGQIAEYLKLNSDERPVTTLPMNYTYGLSIINSHLLVGATILLTDKTLMDRGFWAFMKDEKATSFGGVPYTYEMLEKLRFFRMDLPSLRYMTQAGGKLSPELHRKFAEYAMQSGKEFVVMYGACEATARMGYLPAEKALEKYGSCGISIPRGRLFLLDENGQEITAPEVTGELAYEGENVTLGYAECGEDLALGDERGGRLLTGDMAKFDEDGFFFIVGRKKRFLKIFGNRVNLDEIDRLIKAEFDFIECASSGVDDHMYIFVTDETITDKVRKFISEKTKLNATAFKVIKIDEIPKNDAGKTLYRELEKYIEK